MSMLRVSVCFLGTFLVASSASFRFFHFALLRTAMVNERFLYGARVKLVSSPYKKVQQDRQEKSEFTLNKPFMILNYTHEKGMQSIELYTISR
jgi:hypothetical protein